MINLRGFWRRWIRPVRKRTRIIVDGLYSISVPMTRQLLALGFTIILARVWSKGEFGDYYQVLSVVGVMQIFALPGISTAIAQSVARGFDGTYVVGLRLVLIWSVVGAVLIAMWGGFEIYFTGGEVGRALLIASAFFPLFAGLNQWQQFLVGKSEFRRLAFQQNGIQVLIYLVMISALLVGVRDIALLIGLSVGMASVRNVSISIYTVRRIPRDAPVEDGAIVYGLSTTWAHGFNFVGNYLDKLLLFYLVSAEALAVYVIAERIPELLKDLMQALGKAGTPRLAGRSHYSKQLDRKLNFVSGVIAIGVILFALFVFPRVLPLIYSGKYMDAVSLGQILLFSVALAAFTTIKMVYVTSKLDNKSFNHITVATSGLRILAAAALIPTFGIYGAAVSVVVYRLFAVALVRHYLHRNHSQRPA